LAAAGGWDSKQIILSLDEEPQLREFLEKKQICCGEGKKADWKVAIYAYSSSGALPEERGDFSTAHER
jgi:hypothetical protein